MCEQDLYRILYFWCEYRLDIIIYTCENRFEILQCLENSFHNLIKYEYEEAYLSSRISFVRLRHMEWREGANSIIGGFKQPERHCYHFKCSRLATAGGI